MDMVIWMCSMIICECDYMYANITVNIWMHCTWLYKSVSQCGWWPLTHSTTIWDCGVNYNPIWVLQEQRHELLGYG
jgi:hypothetical protein